MIRSWLITTLAGLIRNGADLNLAGRDRPRLGDKRMADQQMIDELSATTMNTGEPLLVGDQRRQVPQPLRITGIWPIEAAGTDLRPSRTMQGLSRGRRHVVEFTSHNHREPVTEQRSGVGAYRGGLGCPATQGVADRSSSSLGLNRPRSRSRVDD